MTRRRHAVTGRVVEFPAIGGRSVATSIVPPDQNIFVQGEHCDAIYYLHAGTAKAHVMSKAGREAVILLLGPGDFFGEGCFLDNARRVATVTTLTECTIERIEPDEVKRRLANDPTFTNMFLEFLVTRNRQYLVDVSSHHFLSTEQRLAMTLLRLSAGKTQVTLPRLSQETLAGMIGTTRSRVNMFLNKFRRLGMIEYSGRTGETLVVRRSLSGVLGRD